MNKTVRPPDNCFMTVLQTGLLVRRPDARAPPRGTGLRDGQPSEPTIDLRLAEIICHCQKCQVAGGKTDRRRERVRNTVFDDWIIWRIVRRNDAQRCSPHEETSIPRRAGREPELQFSSCTLASRQSLPYHLAK